MLVSFEVKEIRNKKYSFQLPKREDFQISYVVIKLQFIVLLIRICWLDPD